MRSTRKLALSSALLMLSGCHRKYVPAETPMPPHTILLSRMMRQLSAQPGFTNKLLDEIGNAEHGGKKGPALLTPALFNELRRRILGSDWQGLDRFPGWTMHEITPTVDAVDRVAGKSSVLEGASAVHPGAPIKKTPAQSHTQSREHAQTGSQTREYLDLGPYALDKAQTLSLDEPSTFPAFSTKGLVTDLGDGVVRGDGPNALAPEHAQSQRLADALNRLAANKLHGPQTFTVTTHGRQATTPEQLIAALAADGIAITVDDARYFANFGHLHYSASGSSGQAQDVMMPFWIDSKLIVPHSGGRHLLIPAAHAELEWHLHGQNFNADISYYFGVDGKSEWRTMDTLDQAWVLKRNAHEYRGADALEVTRLAGLMTVAYMHLHAAHPTLPFGGYYALGVCQDGVSAIERKMTGEVTLFPNTVDIAFFNDPRDAEINALMAAIPKDRDGPPPSPARIFGSIPTTPAANGDGPFDAVTIPGLASDLNATYSAWKSGNLNRTHIWLPYLALGAGVLLGIVLMFRRSRAR